MPRIVEVSDEWEGKEESTFLDELKGEEQVLIRVPLPSHGRTNSYLDICGDKLDASYLCESLADEFECGPLQWKVENHRVSYLLPVAIKDERRLAAALFRLQWVFNFSQDIDLKELVEGVRDAVANYEEQMSDRRLRYPEIVDSYFANRIGGAYYEYESDQLINEFRAYPERRLGFWQSPYFNSGPARALVSHSAWVIPPGVTKETVFKLYGYSEELSLLNAEFAVLGDTAAFLSEGIVLTTPFKEVANGFACQRFALSADNIDHLLWPGRMRCFASEFKDFVVVETGEMALVIFNLTEQRAGCLEACASTFLEKHSGGIYSDPAVEVDWSRFDDETFEELCYDVIYHSSRFDKDTIRKMGKSRSRDGGRDIVVMGKPQTPGEAPRKFIIQCKAIDPAKSLTTSNLGSMSDVIDQYGASGYVVMTSGVIDATVFDRLDGIAKNRNLEVSTWSRLEIERFLARRPAIASRYLR